MSAMPNTAAAGKLRVAGGAGAPGYVTPAATLDALRARRRVRRMVRDIVEGRWRRVLIDLQMSQFRWPEIESHSGTIQAMLTKINVVRLAIDMHASVLVGTMPSIGVPGEFAEQRAALAGIAERSMLHALLLRAARKLTAEAECAVRVDASAGVALTEEDNERCLPVGPDGPDGQPSVWERRWLIEREIGRRVDRYLRVERHIVRGGRGVVEQEAYLTDSVDVIQDLASLERVGLARAIGAEAAAATPELAETGAERPLVVRMVHAYADGEPVFLLGEHDLDLVDSATAAVTSLARTHKLHATPKVRVPDHMVDRRTGRVNLSEDAVTDPDRVYEYITVDAKLGDMLDYMDRMLGVLLVVLRVSQALIGVKLGGGATPDSYDKLRLEATNTLAHARAAAAYVGPALGRVLTIASQVESAMPMRGYAVAPVSVKMRPQLPRDQVEIAREQRELLEAGLTDRRSALAEIHGEDEADARLAAVERDLDEATRRQRDAVFAAVPTAEGGET